jgi:hypothetical protein
MTPRKDLGDLRINLAIFASLAVQENNVQVGDYQGFKIGLIASTIISVNTFFPSEFR